MADHKHPELHKAERIGWLRAAVLGANDGIVSTGSLIVGVAAAHAARSENLLSGVAGLVAGAMSMAAGEYVSVSSQAILSRPTLPANPENWRAILHWSGRSWPRFIGNAETRLEWLHRYGSGVIQSRLMSIVS